ncbi:YpmS family protein [Oceanobacillus alkalisoli]|uniref:YpmS family protein n=1 Tax=Oceanobacillus alkalisoli TaxID=2925113 RepID=UPI001F11D5B8|nr:YpmS family protein [Oceanobacillus alkalisoli]MCF3943510.1 YpmS family protein [Oceanobacillus alkalisoli]
MARTDKHKPKLNWKKGFFLILALNIAGFLLLISLIFWPAEDVELPSETEKVKQESSEFVVRTSKENLNSLINAYIEHLTENTRHKYRIELEEDVHLIGELPVFSTTVPISMRFEPEVVENGDIILRQESISLGLLELPNRRIMQYLDRYLPMPDWVIVDPNEEEIYIAITDMDIRSNFELAVESLDLKENNLAFRISVPYETFGIESWKMFP